MQGRHRFAKAVFKAYDLWTGADPATTTTRPPMSTPLADALLTIGNHPLCSVEVEQSDDNWLSFFLENDQTGDIASESDLEASLALYDQAGAPYRLTVLLPVDEESIEPEGWQSPTAYERNTLAYA